MARPERFELPTLWFVAKYSIQLSYGRIIKQDSIFWLFLQKRFFKFAVAILNW